MRERSRSLSSARVPESKQLILGALLLAEPRAVLERDPNARVPAMADSTAAN
ncbi:MAG: hypothetical protein ACJAYU_003027 [Bradymonadia bacterium]|jgi:hypothetical protein